MLDVSKYGEYGVVNSLDVEISKLRRRVCHLVKSIHKENPDKYFNDVYVVILSDKIDEGCLGKIWDSYIISLRSEGIDSSIFLAAFYLVLAEKALGFGCNDSSWFYVGRSFMYLGFGEGLWSMKNIDSSLDRSEISRKAGLARGEKNRFIQEEVARLLRDHRPDTGWKNIASAINEIQPIVAEFIKNKRSDTGLSITNLAATIRRWIRDHERIRSAYDGN